MRKRFLIINPARSGSTMLRRMLDKHPEINCKGEIITRKTVQAEDLMKFLRTDAFHKVAKYKDAEKVRAVGFKFKYHEYFNVFSKFPKFLSANQDVLIIHLRRKNLLKRYISGETTKLRTEDKYATIGGDKPQQIRFEIDCEHALKNIQKIERFEKNISELNQSHKVIDVYYEDLAIAEKRAEILHQIFKNLEVQDIKIQPDTIKQNSDSIEDIIINYGALASEMEKKGYNKFLEN